MQICFEVTLYCVCLLSYHRCIAEPHIAEYNKDIKMYKVSDGDIHCYIRQSDLLRLGTFEIILDPLCQLVDFLLFL